MIRLAITKGIGRHERTHILQLVDLSSSFEQLLSPFTSNLLDLLVVVSDLDV
jgi:hypothetical protein